MSNLKNISLRLDKETLEKIELLSKFENLDKSIILRRAIESGLKELSLECAITGFSKEELSYSEGAKLSDMYVGEFMELLSRRGVKVSPYSDDLKRHLNDSEKKLIKRLSDIKKTKYK
jgi:predicted HTH domain antitoxin